MILMDSSLLLSSLEASVRDSYLILSRASEELEIEFPQEDLLVAVKCVDDQRHQLR